MSLEYVHLYLLKPIFHELKIVKKLVVFMLWKLDLFFALVTDFIRVQRKFRLQSLTDSNNQLISHDISAIFFLLHTNFCMLFCLQRTMKCGFYLRKKNLIKKNILMHFSWKGKKVWPASGKSSNFTTQAGLIMGYPAIRCLFYLLYEIRPVPIQ